MNDTSDTSVVPSQTFSIGELATEFGITTRTIRFYEARGLIAPERRRHVRVYSRRDRARLALVLRGKNLGFSLEDIRMYLELYDHDHGQIAQTRLLLEKIEQHLVSLEKKSADLDRSIGELKEIRRQCLDHLAATLPSGSLSDASTNDR